MDAVQRLVELLRLALTWWFFVEPWEQAIRLRAGKHMERFEPGVHFRIPFLDSVYVHNTHRMVLFHLAQTVSSADGKVFTVSASVSYVIKDVELLHTSPHYPENVIGQEASQMVASFVNSRDAAAITPELLRAYMSTLDLSAYGLGEVQVCINNFAVVQTYRLVQG